MTPLEKCIAELRALCEKATAPPWEPVHIDDTRGQPVPYYRGLIATFEHSDRYLSLVLPENTGRCVPKEEWPANLEFCAQARTVLPQALDALEVLSKAGEKLQRYYTAEMMSDRPLKGGKAAALIEIEKLCQALAQAAGKMDG